MAHLRRDVILLFSARSVRLFAYGALSVILALYLHAVGLSGTDIGLLFTLTLIGDAGISIWITTTADRFGRKRMLLLGASLMIFAGVVYIFTGDFILLSIAAIIGVISPSGNEIGPFLSLEQAALSQLLPAESRTKAFALYNLAGSLATASGALTAGFFARAIRDAGLSELASYRSVILMYAICGFTMMLIFIFLSPAVETGVTMIAKKRVLGLHESKNVIMKLSALFALDAFAGGFVIQSLVAYWFHFKFSVDPAVIGSIFFGANILAGVSGLLAVSIANRIGLINTMVFTHVPSNVLLCLVPLMPNLSLAIVVLLCRFSISQMDVPTRQSYTMAVVFPDERSAASGVTTIARSLGAAVSPALSGLLLASPSLMNYPFLVSGGLKICYDLLLYKNFKHMSKR
jgi:MFS family permease